jgi:hypothetical protein
VILDSVFTSISPESWFGRQIHWPAAKRRRSALPSCCEMNFDSL